MDGEGSDRWLVARVQSGDDQAFGSLVKKYRGRLLKLAERYTRNPADAEDVVQEAFLKAFRSLHQFRGDSAFYSWMHRIVINSAKTALVLQSRQRTLFTSSDDRQDLLQDSPGYCHAETPQDLAMSEELGRALDGAISALPEEQRVAIALREIQGLSYSQVADSMACPIGTVRSRIFRGRDAINEGLRRFFQVLPDANPRERHIARCGMLSGAGGPEACKVT